MSRSVATLVYSRQVGSMARKAVLAYMADRANDDGSGVWAAKQRIADEIECSKQTVITTVKALVADGLISETGRRPNSNGYTVEYCLNLDAIARLPEFGRDGDGVQNWTGPDLDGSTSLTARGQTALPKPSLNRPTPSRKRAREPEQREVQSDKARYHRMPDGWSPTRPLPARIAARVDEWPPGKLDDEIEAMRGWARNAPDQQGKGRKLDWDAAWAVWLKKADEDWRARGNGHRSRQGNAASTARVDQPSGWRLAHDALPAGMGDAAGG